MRPFSRIYDWIVTWKHPVSAVVVSRLEAASLELATTIGKSDSGAIPHELLMRSGGISIHGLDDAGLKASLRRLLSFVQGRPTAVSLHQKASGGMIGPHAKARKAGRSKGTISENAVMFFAQETEIPEKRVMKIAVGQDRLAREIRMMKTLGRSTGSTPSLLANCPRQTWYVTEFVESVGAQGAPSQALMYLEEIATRHFEYFGCKSRQTGSHLHRIGMPEDKFAGLAHKLGFERELELLLAGSLTVSITHGGGICEECRKTPDGKVYLLDWEKARLAPIADDLLQAFDHHPEKALAVMDKLRGKTDLDSARQLAVALVLRHAFNTKKSRPMKEKLRQDVKSAEVLHKMMN